MSAAARTRFRSQTCGLSRVFSDVHAAGKHDFTLFRRLRMAELCEALTAQSAEIHFTDSLRIPYQASFPFSLGSTSSSDRMPTSIMLSSGSKVV